MVLGPEEYVDKRVLNSASTVLAMWRKLQRGRPDGVESKETTRTPGRQQMEPGYVGPAWFRSTMKELALCKGKSGSRGNFTPLPTR
jgi:hypothetical protein